jgi:hypothetical protein
VNLIAGALGVPPGVFREAFSHVQPAPAGSQPQPGQVRQNKTALMNALGKYGITNERLDQVSNYYRYRSESGKLWPTQEASAVALVRAGKVTAFEVTNGGSGYSSAPSVSIPAAGAPAVKVQLSFGKDFDKNGSVKALTLQP